MPKGMSQNNTKGNKTMTAIKFHKDADGQVKASFKEEPKKPKISENAIKALVPQAVALIELFSAEDVTCQSSLARTKKARAIYKRTKDPKETGATFWLKRSAKSGELLARLRIEGESGTWQTTIGETWASCTCPDTKQNPDNVCKHLRALAGLVLNPPDHPSQAKKEFVPVQQIPNTQKPKDRYPYDPTF